MQSFLKYTAQHMKSDLKQINPELLQRFRVDAKDRQYQFWERNPLSLDLFTEPVFKQKPNYIHENPIKEKCLPVGIAGKLAVNPEEY